MKKELTLVITLDRTKLFFDLKIKPQLFDFKYEIDYKCEESAWVVFNCRSNKENCRNLVDHILLASTMLERNEEINNTKRAEFNKSFY